MKKIFLILAITLATNAYSQVNTKLMSCNGTGFPFSVQFSGNFATATFKGFSHTIPFDRTFIGKNGDTWFVYQNRILDISITPYDNYVTLYKPNTSEVLAGAYCK